MQKSLFVNKNVADGSHDTNHVSVASDMLCGTQTEVNKIVNCDMPIDSPVDDKPRNEVAEVVVSLNAVTFAGWDMPITDVTYVVTAINPASTRKFFLVTSVHYILGNQASWHQKQPLCCDGYLNTASKVSKSQHKWYINSRKILYQTSVKRPLLQRIRPFDDFFTKLV